MRDVLGLRDKPCLVVGGGSGIGRATALMLGAAGANVAVADLDGDQAKVVAEEIADVGGSAIAVAGDVTDAADATRVVTEAHDRLGGLLGVANIVGIASWADLLSVEEDDWEAQLRINLTQHLYVGRAAARHMIDDGVAGALAFLTSVAALYGAPHHAAYGAAKAGASSLGRSMANEWGSYGIRVNTVAPDFIAAPRTLKGFAELGVTDLDANARVEGVPLGRWGTPDEIAGPLVYLLSDLSSYTSGQDLVVDGGTRTRYPHTNIPFGPGK